MKILAVDIESGVSPGEKAVRPFGAEELPGDGGSQDLAGEEFRQPGVVVPGDFVEEARLIHSTLGHQELEVRVTIDPVYERLNGGNNPGHQLPAGYHLKITRQRAESRAAELPQQPAVVLEEYPQHPGDGEEDLAVRDIEEECLPHPLSPLLQPLGMARRTETTGAAGKHQDAFRMAVGTADAGEPAARVAAVEVALDDFLDDGPEEPVLLLEAALILVQETVEIMEQHSVDLSRKKAAYP